MQPKAERQSTASRDFPWGWPWARKGLGPGFLRLPILESPRHRGIQAGISTYEDSSALPPPSPRGQSLLPQAPRGTVCVSAARCPGRDPKAPQPPGSPLSTTGLTAVPRIGYKGECPPPLCPSLAPAPGPAVPLWNPVWEQVGYGPNVWVAPDERLQMPPDVIFVSLAQYVSHARDSLAQPCGLRALRRPGGLCGAGHLP